MNKEQQIEEMARILNPDSCFDKDISECRKMESCYVCNATKLYNAGYRKQTEIAGKIFAEIEEFMEVALMNGDVQQPILCIGMGAFEAIKKRYTKGDQ